MSTDIFYQNILLRDLPTLKKQKEKEKKIALNLKNKKTESSETKKSNNQTTTKKAKFNTNKSNSINQKKSNNVCHYNRNKKNILKSSTTASSNNKFMFISDYPETYKDNIYDNLNYIRIFENSVDENLDDNTEKIKTVDVNNYINNENKSLATFKDLKLKLLDKKTKLNSPFVFYKKDINIDDSKIVENEKNYQIKRYRYLKSFRYSFNPVIRSKNAKVIQKWWKSKIVPKIKKRKKIILMQSVFRGYITRKNLNDIICISVVYQNFINKISNALSNFVHRNYFPKRYYKKKYALEKIFPIKLKLFFRKWKKYNKHYVDQVKAADFLFKIRSKKRYVLLVLKTYFNIWKLKCEQYNQNEDKILSIKNQNQKYSALSKLFNSIEKIGKKKSYYKSKDNIHKYLRYIYQKKYAKKLFELYGKYNLYKYLKKYFNVWRKHNWKEREKDLKLKILANEIRTRIRINDKDFIRNNLNNLRTQTNLQNINSLKRAKKVFLFPEGMRHIIACVRKNVIRLKFKDYIRKRNIKKKIEKIIQRKLKKYFMKKWKSLIKTILYKDKAKLHLKTIILKLGHLSNNLFLSKYFNCWKNKVLMNKYKDKKINIYNSFCKSLKKYILNNNKKLSEYKKIFFTKKIKRYINPDSEIIKKKLFRCFNIYIHKNKKIKIKNYFEKWKRFVHFCQLNDVKAKNIKIVATLTKIIYDTKKKSSNLHEWKEKMNLMKLIDENTLKENINNLVQYLNMMKKNRQKKFFNSLKKAKQNAIRKTILKILTDKYAKKKMSKYFNKYKINAIKLQNKHKIENINKLNKLKAIINNKIKKKEKNNYGLLKKNLYKWYFISKLINKENYNQFLLNIKNALTIINSVTTRKMLRTPLKKIIHSNINTKNIILKRLKKYFYKNDKINLSKAFHKMLKNIRYNSKNIIKSNIIYVIKLKNEQINKKTLLTKYFNRWKMLANYHNKILNDNTSVIWNIMCKIIKRRKQRAFFDKMKKIKHNYYLNKNSKYFYGIYNIVEKRVLFKHLHKWKNNAKKLSTIITQREKCYTIIYNTLSKAYFYKKLEDVVIPLLINHYKKRHSKIFFNKFKELYWVKTNSKYKAVLKNSNIPKKYNFKFQKSIRPNNAEYNDNNNTEKKDNENNIKKIDDKGMAANKRNSRYKVSRLYINRRSIVKKEEEIVMKNVIMSNTINNKKNNFYKERLIPYLVKYLNGLRQKKLRLVFQYLGLIKRNDLFCNLLKSWSKRQNLVQKEHLKKSIKQSKNKIQLNRMIRRSIINKLTNKYLIETKRRNDLLILVHKTRVLKKMNKIKKTLRFLRIWRVYVKCLRDRAAQLERFEKNFNETCEKISESVFLDNGNEKSVQTQVLRFLDKVTYEEKTKIKNHLGVSQTSLNSYLSGKIINNDIMNSSYSSIFNYNNDNNNESTLSINCNRGNYYKIESYSNSNSPRKFGSSLFSKNKKK